MSSDSEDDCYGNIAQRLQTLKNKYRDDKIECSNLLNDSTKSTNELDEIVNKAAIPAVCEIKDSPEVVQTVEITDDKETEDFIDNLLATTSTRVTRAGAKKRNLNISVPDLNSNHSRKKKRGSNAVQSNIDETRSSNTENVIIQTNRSRGRSRGQSGSRTSRGRRGKRQTDWSSQAIPTYSVGNTDEYPDQSNEQQLFSNVKSNDVVIIEEEDPLDDNEELSVKVYWQNSEFFKFPIRKYQKLTQIFNYFSKKENISHDKLLLTYNDHVLKPTDTPDSIKYNIVKFIDGGIVNQSVSKLTTKEKEKITENGVKIKFQCQNVKQPYVTTIQWEDKLSLAMTKCSEHFELPLDKLRFEFDGDTISGKSTPKELEFEGGECIDVKVMS
ncbi:uncharacterized protein LOC113510511 [Galleria mellonella]|uniref:Uncharacterized protein LOC113510511 n=1 Tax=Galleria mellonella TaxID=7137 RepID=A0A6J1W9P1_GALME|nr:uncharacterized protein LOC113510511 [Galleria mellonella]